MLSGTGPDSPGGTFRTIDFSGRAHVLAAVSGGSDSLALLLLLHDHLKANHPRVALHAATVDHGLRPDSADEARWVASLCAARGIPHTIHVWDGPKPSTGIAAAAREARYRLLAEAADAIGTDLLFTGHTMDDQAETVAMRAARGEGRGLAGMAAATLYDGRVWIVRPFLTVRRAALRGWLVTRGIGWMDDPGNANAGAERVRLRRAMTETESMRLSELAQAEGIRRRTLGAAASRLIAEAATLQGDGAVRIERGAFGAADAEARTYALRLLLVAVGRRAHPPDRDRTAALLARLDKEPPVRATLAGVLAEVRRDAIVLRRERRRNMADPDVSLVGAGLPRFLPGFDLEPATALARLFGGAEPPAAPLPASCDDRLFRHDAHSA